MPNTSKRESVFPHPLRSDSFLYGGRFTPAEAAKVALGGLGGRFLATITAKELAKRSKLKSGNIRGAQIFLGAIIQIIGQVNMSTLQIASGIGITVGALAPPTEGEIQREKQIIDAEFSRI